MDWIFTNWSWMGNAVVVLVLALYYALRSRRRYVYSCEREHAQRVAAEAREAIAKATVNALRDRISRETAMHIETIGDLREVAEKLEACRLENDHLTIALDRGTRMANAAVAAGADTAREFDREYNELKRVLEQERQTLEYIDGILNAIEAEHLITYDENGDFVSLRKLTKAEKYAKAERWDDFAARNELRSDCEADGSTFQK